MTVLLGDSSTHTTMLHALNNYAFEVLNLIQKRLILINDTEQYIKKWSW